MFVGLNMAKNGSRAIFSVCPHKLPCGEIYGFLKGFRNLEFKIRELIPWNINRLYLIFMSDLY